MNNSIHLNCGLIFRFWEAVQELKALPQSEVQNKVSDIWIEFLAPDASCPINVDSKSYELTKKNMEVPDRWSFDCAAVCRFILLFLVSISRISINILISPDY